MDHRRTNIIYSTHPETIVEDVKPQEELCKTEQDLRVHLDRRGGGKIVTLIRGFVGTKNDCNALGKELRKKCGVGGTVKHNEILVQGNVRELVLNILIKKGYRAKPSGG
ncbi:MAG: translation initiation factor [Candidatus Marinimicrobia bacterium]|nr:translation initiation factor [Candidatus Neomarinimicrobiota bacterium]